MSQAQLPMTLPSRKAPAAKIVTPECVLSEGRCIHLARKTSRLWKSRKAPARDAVAKVLYRWSDWIRSFDLHGARSRLRQPYLTLPNYNWRRTMPDRERARLWAQGADIARDVIADIERLAFFEQPPPMLVLADYFEEIGDARMARAARRDREMAPMVWADAILCEVTAHSLGQRGELVREALGWARLLPAHWGLT